MSQSQLHHAVLNTAFSVEDYACGDINICVCVGMMDDNWEKTFISQPKDSKDVPVEDVKQLEMRKLRRPLSKLLSSLEIQTFLSNCGH